MAKDHCKAYLQLTRFPLIFTVWADVLAGYFIAAHDAEQPMRSAEVGIMLLVAACLYWAGMLLHDAFKWEAAREHGRPVPLPQGIVSTTSAFATSILLMLVGVGAAGFVSTAAGLAAVVVGILLVVFASITREIVFFSSLTMAICRGGNVILGMAFMHKVGFPVTQATQLGPVAALIGYVFVVTQISLEEETPRAEPLVLLTGSIVVILLALTGCHYFTSLSDASWSLALVTSFFVLAAVLRILQVAGLVGTVVLDANFVAFAGHAGPTFGVLFLFIPTFLMLRFFHALYPGARDAIE